MNPWLLFALLIVCVVVTYVWMVVWEKIAGPADRDEDTTWANGRWGYWDGQDWKEVEWPPD